ncbi:MAG: DUF5615 family PIN-like protein [Chloroflexota bacterium]|nr:DUF5615 family PIN-like protein [Chloroflexota bacterium]
MTDRADAELRALYIKLYFDEDVSVDIVKNLRTRGFDVLCARDVPLLGRDDAIQLDFAVSQERAIVTHNRVDFEVLHQQHVEVGKQHWGIIIAKRRARPGQVVARLLDLLDRVPADEVKGQLRYL